MSSNAFVTKTVAGFTLLAGIFIMFVAASVVSWSGNVIPSPADDWKYDLAGWLAIAGGLVGIGMFFFGAMFYSRR